MNSKSQKSKPATLKVTAAVTAKPLVSNNL